MFHTLDVHRFCDSFTVLKMLFFNDQSIFFSYLLLLWSVKRGAQIGVVLWSVLEQKLPTLICICDIDGFIFWRRRYNSIACAGEHNRCHVLCWILSFLHAECFCWTGVIVERTRSFYKLSKRFICSIDAKISIKMRRKAPIGTIYLFMFWVMLNSIYIFKLAPLNFSHG